MIRAIRGQKFDFSPFFQINSLNLPRKTECSSTKKNDTAIIRHIQIRHIQKGAFRGDGY